MASQLQLLRKLQRQIEPLMLLLGLVWLALLVIELIWGLSSTLQTASLVIWAIFIFEFLVMLLLAPNKGRFLAGNWFSALALLIPAIRLLAVFRVLRLARFLRFMGPLRLARITAAIHRAQRSLYGRMARRRLAYVTIMTAIVIFTGAAGMYAFERHANAGFATYGDSLWWTAMILTTLGSGFWPVTMEGRILGFLIGVYTFGVFGYFTATLASFFVGRDKMPDDHNASRKAP